MPDIKKIDCDRILNEAPRKMEEISKKAEDSRFLWKEAEIRLKQMEAKVHMMCKAENPELTIADLEAQCNSDQGLYEQRLAVISHESLYRKDLIEQKSWEDAWISARKLMGIENDVNKITSYGK